MAKTKNNRLGRRMLRSYALVFGLIITIILGLIYAVLFQFQTQQASLNHQLLVSQPVKQVERFVDELDDAAYKAMSNQELIALFAALREEADPDNYFASNVMDDIDTASLLAGLNRSITPVWRMSAYNAWGDFISTGTIVDAQRVPETLAGRDPAALMAYFSENPDVDYILYTPGLDPWSDYYKSTYVSLVRPIMNVYSRDVVGIVEVQQNMLVLEEYLGLEEDGFLAVNIYDGQGSPVLLSGREGDVVVAASTVDKFGWRVELLESKNVQQGSSLQLLGILMAVWVVLMVVVVAVIAIIATRVSRPLTLLTEEVQKIDVTAPQKLPPVDTRVNEVVSLQQAFDEVMERLTFTTEQEKKSFLLAMQAQMNPHFLYNVLSVINAVALEGREDVVVAICGNLSGMLRYSSSYEKGTATVAEEMEHTTAYLELMRARYDEMFQYDVQMHEALASRMIPKLVIQPICENAFTHPFANMEPPYRLAIRVYPKREGWCIEVEDNGSGFDDSAKADVMRRANEANYEDLSGLQIGGLGIISSVMRLKLMTQQDVHCEILDAQPHGAVVRISIGDTGANAPEGREGL